MANVTYYTYNNTMNIRLTAGARREVSLLRVTRALPNPEITRRVARRADVFDVRAVAVTAPGRRHSFYVYGDAGTKVPDRSTFQY